MLRGTHEIVGHVLRVILHLHDISQFRLRRMFFLLISDLFKLLDHRVPVFAGYLLIEAI